MAAFKFSFVVGVLFMGTSLPFFVSSEKIVLDALSDEAKAWIEVTCIYHDDYNDFWTFGCPANVSPEDDVYPTRRGFWSPCSAQKCEMHYYGGGGVPQAESITLSLYMKGDPQVLITSKYGATEEEYSNKVGEVSGKDKNGWVDFTIDLRGQNHALILNFTLLSSGNEVLIVDKITIDLGEDTTVPPPTTTSRPIEGDVVTLDKDTDYWLLWDVSCTHAKFYQDFWVYGCPTNYKEDQSVWYTDGGYWSACDSTKNCRMRYLGNGMDSPISVVATSMAIYAYLEGDARINITLQEFASDSQCRWCKPVQVIEANEETNGKWTRTLVNLYGISARRHLVNIDLSSGTSGTVIIERIELSVGRTELTSPPPVTTTIATKAPETSTTIAKAVRNDFNAIFTILSVFFTAITMHFK